MVITHDKFMTLQSLIVLHLSSVERETGKGVDRDELIDWVFEHFGSDKVAMVSAHQTFGRRAAFHLCDRGEAGGYPPIMFGNGDIRGTHVRKCRPS